MRGAPQAAAGPDRQCSDTFLLTAGACACACVGAGTCSCTQLLKLPVLVVAADLSLSLSSSCPAGYTASIVYCLITMLLFNTQQDLENPFDMQGMDDVFFVMDREMDDCWQPLVSMAGACG